MYVKIKLSRVINLCVVWLLLITSASNEDSDVCLEESNGTVLWPETICSTCVKSKPICISEDREIVTRCCGKEGIWEELPRCTYFQETIDNPCPPNFINDWVNNTCMLVIENSTYPPSCPYKDNLPFYEYVSEVDPDLFPIWMPIVRDTENYGIGLLHWMEPTSNYKTIYTACDDESCNDYHFSEYLKGKNCLVFHNYSYAEAVPCNGNYTAVCAYKSLPDRKSGFCIQNFQSTICMQSDYSALSKCFCYGSTYQQSKVAKAEFHQPYQNLLYPAMTNEVCHIGLYRFAEGIYNWAYSNSTISYTNWAEDTTFGEEYAYGAMSPSGWILTKTDDELECVIYQTDPPVDEGEISLEYDLQNKQFALKISNPLMWVFIENGSFPMVFCFTDAANDSLITRIDVTVSLILTNYVYYSFQPHSDGPGTYWCEAFVYPDISAKRSNEYLLRYVDTHNEEYAVILKTNYAKGTNPITDSSIKSLQKLLADQIPPLPYISSFYPRVYKIVDIDEDNLEITINFHLINHVQSEPLRYYSALRGYMEQNLTIFSFVNVFGVDSCVGIQTVSPPQTVTWPITPINSVAPKPREGYCLRKDGSIMSRYCIGNYIDGAQWSELDETCIIQESTNITVNLTNIVNLNNSIYYISQVAEIAANPFDLAAVDIQLISEFLAQIAGSNEINLNLTADIISDLMAVPDNVLKESQNLFNATDRILYYVDEIIKNAQFIGIIIKENIVITSHNIIATKLSGIALQEYGESDYNVEKIFDIEEIKQIDNLKAAVILSDELLLQIYRTENYDSRIIVTIYKNSSFFEELDRNNKNLGVIIGVLLPDFDDQCSGNIYTIYSINDIGNDFNCSFWTYLLGIKRGYWEYETQTDDHESLLTCAYDHLTHLAVVQKEVVNITHELESILFSDDSLSEKLEKASLLTKNYYLKFQPVDVLLLSKILYIATDSNEDNLDLVADILNKIIDIPAEILQKSQLMYNATGKILIYFDEILQQFGSSKIVQRINFYAIVQFLNEDNIYGFTINKCESTYNFTLLRTETDMSDISASQYLDTALLLSKDLVNQLVNGGKENYTPKIVVTVFFKDALFIEDYGNPKITTKVVGISIPNFDDALNGGINVLYTVDFNIASNYTCSVYVSDDNEATYEKGFWNSENPPELSKNYLDCRFWKPGYFALVYSLINFTSSLEFMLNSDQPIELILNQTELITSNYTDYLQTMDVFIIAQLLSKVTEVNTVILETSLSIVSNVMKISRDILQASQEIYNATDKILYYFGNIAENYNTSKEIYKDNIIVIVSLLSETGMYGLALEDCIIECSISILYNKSSIHYKGITMPDTELKITSDLINQLLEAENENYIPKLILTVYYNDALFNEKAGRRNISKIFGIHFPKYNNTLSSDIKLYFNSNMTNPTDGYNCAIWEYQEDENIGIVKGSWSSQSQARINDMLTCNFYQQSYFTLIDGSSIYDNITDALATVLAADIYFQEKLYRTEDISYYYLGFEDKDVSLVSEILAQCDQLGDDGLERLITIINNIVQVPRKVLISSQDKYNALRKILRSINYIASFVKSHSYCSIKDPFALIVCPLNPISVSGVIVTKTGLSCMYNIDEESVTNTAGSVAGILLSKELLNQTISDENISKIVFTFFLDNALFDTENIQNTSAIFGISLPNFSGILEGNITALFNNSFFDRIDFDCAFWEDINIWNVADRQSNADLFTKCIFRNATYLALIENSTRVGGINISEALKEILTGDYTGSEKLNLTNTVVSLYTDQLKAAHVHLVAQILSYIDEISLTDLEKTADIANNIMKITREVLVESQEKYNATDWILYQVDRIAGLFKGTAEIEIENFAIIVTNNITGLFIETCKLTCTFRVHILRGDVNLTSLKTNDDVNTALILDDLLVAQMQEEIFSNIVLTIYFNDALFNEGYNVSYKNIGQIIGTVIPSLNGEMKGSVKVYYYSQDDSPEMCAFWNYTVDNDEMMRGHWEKDKVSVQPSQLCLCESSQATHFALLQGDKNVTSDLENILNSNSTIREKLEKVGIITAELPTQLTPVDIYLISKILLYALDEVGPEELSLTSHIISALFQVPRAILRESQVTYCATDRILHSLDEMARLMDQTDESPIVQEHFVIAVYDLKTTNISGLILESCGSTKCNISTLENSVNLTELARNENLETAVALSDDLLKQVRQSKGSPKLAVTVFFSDVLFNEPVERDKKTSMVCGVLLPGLNESLTGSLYLMFNTAEYVDYNNSCAFWNFQVNGEEEILSGSWATDVDPRSKEHFTICEFDHVTHFALLLANGNSSFADANVYKVLDIITAVNCVLSVVGIFGILLTAALFERWRKNTGNQILVNFAIAISIKMVMLYVSVGVYEADVHDLLCSVTGAILHYALLSEFCWMLIIAILQFKRFVEVLGGPPKYVLLKACVCGWVFPILPILLILLIDGDNYNEGQVGLCYPSGLGLYLGVWLPLIIIITINFVIFIFIIYNVFHKKTESRDLVNHEILFQWRLALLLFSMLGLTWLFGFMAQIQGATYIFVYLFCFTATLQGFVMFLFFIVFNKSTRFLYAQAIKLWLYSRGYKVR